MEIIDRIRELCRKNGISVTKLEAALGYGNGSISKASTTAMRSDRLKAIADYFGVTMEYLMTGKYRESGNNVIYEVYDSVSSSPKEIDLSITDLKSLDPSTVINEYLIHNSPSNYSKELRKSYTVKEYINSLCPITETDYSPTALEIARAFDQAAEYQQLAVCQLLGVKYKKGISSVQDVG